MTTIETPLDISHSTDLAADATPPLVTPARGLSVYRDEEAPVETIADEPSTSQESPLTWRGVRLYPFNSSRSCLFAQHRLALGAPSLQLCIDDVEGFLADALRILWLCSHTPADYQTLRCSPPQLQTVIDEWADEAKIDAVAAVMLGLKIFADSRPPAI